MTPAEKAFLFADKLIASAITRGADRLSFNRVETRALERLPTRITAAPKLRRLNLERTRISDLTEIGKMPQLKFLELNRTRVRDLGPLSACAKLAELGLDATDVDDLRPLASLARLSGLGLNDTRVHDLSPLADHTQLTALALDNAPVADLGPIAGLTNLTGLWINGTKVTDLSALSGLENLRELWLSSTLAQDLRPIRSLKRLVQSPTSNGLRFDDCTAACLDPTIARIAQIPDPRERAERLFQHLDGWTQPLPDPDPMIEAEIEDDRIEVPATTPSAAEQEERVKQIAHEALQDKAARLAQKAGNQHFNLAERARMVVEQVEPPLRQVDLLRLHLAVDDLQGMADLGRDSEDADPFPPEVAILLGDVLRTAPGLTLGNPDVDLLVERANRRRTSPPVPEAELEAQDEMSHAVASDPMAIGDRLRMLEQIVAGSDSAEDREVQKSANRSVLWRIASVCAQGGAIVATNVVAAALAPPILIWLQAHAGTLLAAAQTYGPVFLAWFVLCVGPLPQFAGVIDKFAAMTARRRRPLAPRSNNSI